MPAPDDTPRVTVQQRRYATREHVCRRCGMVCWCQKCGLRDTHWPGCPNA